MIRPDLPQIHTAINDAVSEVDAPFSVYLDTAREQVKRNPGGLADQEGVARALAVINRDADRRDRHYLANKASIDAARAAADRSIDRYSA